MLKHALVIAIVAIASRASAQSIFIQGSIGADVRRFSAEPEKSAFDGTARAIAFGGGAEFIPHWVVSAEADLGGRATAATTRTILIAGAPQTIHNSYTSRRRSVSAIAGYRTSRRRSIQVGCYGGVSFTSFRREIVSDAESIVLQSAAPGSVYDERLTGAIVAVDIAVRAGPHFAVVPAMRAQPLRIGTDLGGHSLRPSIGARFSF